MVEKAISASLLTSYLERRAFFPFPSGRGFFCGLP